MLPDRRPDPTALVRCVVAAQAGCHRSFDQLHRWYGPLVTHVVRSRTGGHDEVPDLVQETFLRAWTGLGSLRDPACLGAWLCQIARRVAADHGRLSRGRPQVVEMHDGIGEHGPCPSVEVEHRESLAQAVLAVGSLAPRDARVIVLAVRHDSASEPIAEVLGIGAGHAKVVLHRARQRLRDAVA